MEVTQTGKMQMCTQCGVEKALSAYRKVTNQYTGVHPMSICRDCYKANQEAHEVQAAATWEASRAAHQEQRAAMAAWSARQAELAVWAEQHRLEEEARTRAAEAWCAAQPPRRCVECKQVLPERAFGLPHMQQTGEELEVFTSRKVRCEFCHDAYRRRNRQLYPSCLLCGTSTESGAFLRMYQGFSLDLIRFCCEACIPRFLALSESEQLLYLRRGIVAAYGEQAVVYAIQDDAGFPLQHIGRTKHYTKRMATYCRRWERPILRTFVLQPLSFGGLSMEYESRWMLHALKYGWPIDNFARLEAGVDESSPIKGQEERLRALVAHIEPLTDPYAVVGPLVERYFIGAADAAIVNWYCEQAGLRPGEEEIRERMLLAQRLYGLPGWRAREA
jgi:hypothetical protein